MGDNPFYHHHARHQLDDHPRHTPSQKQGASDQANGEEEDYTIKCICGFSDDDGHTTLCEQCNTWQHVDCYYHHTNLQVPEVHKCVDCSPQQPPDLEGAALRQRLKRDPSATNEDRKAKRSGAKGHRKSRTKDLSSIALNHVNGWSRHDSPDGHRSTSPHEHGPPFKRAKTHHRDQASGPPIFVDSNGTDSHTDVISTQPTSRPPLSQCPSNYLSPDFIRAHQDDPNFQLAHPGEQNDHDIAVVNEMGTWLDDPEAFAAATNGKRHLDVLQRYGSSWKDHEPPVHKTVRQDTTAVFHGAYPLWTHLVASRPIQKEELVGELIGEIGKREQYIADPDNQWDRLRHPDHFVFFHPQLPIYIDCRSRGSILRHARRGCTSNVKLSTFIEDRHWRFAFTSTRDIPEDEEIVVEWSLVDRTLLDCLRPFQQRQPLEQAQEDYLTSWASNVLAHFGGCACENQYHAQCAVGKFDRRLLDHDLRSRSDQSAPNNRHHGHYSPTKTDTNNHFPDPARQKSPTHDSHHEGEDAVSSSRSSPSTTSRDQTPVTNGASARPNGLGNEPSEREKKKMQEQARLIEKMDQEQQRAQTKKKRRSGSNPNTPIAPTSKQSQYPRPSAFPPPLSVLQPKMPRSKTESHLNTTTHEPPYRAASDSPVKSVSRPNHSEPTRARLIYVDAGVQTQPQVLAVTLSQRHHAARMPYKPLSQRLLRRNHLLRAAQLEQQPEEVTSTDRPSSPLPPKEAVGAEPYSADSDVQMEIESTFSESRRPEDPENISAPESPSSTTVGTLGAPKSPQAVQSSPEPPPPPWASQSPEAKKEDMSSGVSTGVSDHALSELPTNSSQRPTNLRVDLPPSQFSSSTSADPRTAGSTGSITGNTVQSPCGSVNSPQFAAPVAPMSAPLMTPTTPSVAQPSPIKKKMSLADYSKRRASQAQTPGADRRPSWGNSSPSASSDPPATPGVNHVAVPLSARSDEVDLKKEPELDN